MIHKDSGSITILGKDNQDNIELTKEDIGVVLDEVGLPECLTAQQVGNVMKHTFRNWDDAEYAQLLKKLALPEQKRFKAFSRGMKMKLGIAIAMSHNSKLLIWMKQRRGLIRWFAMRSLRCSMISQETKAILFSFLRISSVILKTLRLYCIPA